MDPQIHGAIVGGAIGGVTLGLAVAGEHWLARITARRADIEAAAVEVDQITFRLADRMIRTRFDSDDTASVAALRTDLDAFQRLMTTFVRRARWPMRRAGEIQAEARRTNATLTKLASAWARGDTLSTEFIDFTGNRLSTLAHGGDDLLAGDELEDT